MLVAVGTISHCGSLWRSRSGAPNPLGVEMNHEKRHCIQRRDLAGQPVVALNFFFLQQLYAGGLEPLDDDFSYALE